MGNSDSDCELHLVVFDSCTQFHFIFGEEAQARSLDGIPYGREDNGQYFVIGTGSDRDTHGGLFDTTKYQAAHETNPKVKK